MRTKLALKLEDLSVDSFATTTPPHPGGTVFGEQCTCQTVCTCPGCPTCDASCNGSCFEASCGGSCEYSCAFTCAGDTCDYATCDPDYCAVSMKYTNCNHICY